jgi:hypothetical protein
MGPILYDERDVYRAAQTGMALDALFPERKIPIPITNPVLRAFANAIWQCASATEVVRRLRFSGQWDKLRADRSKEA